MHIAISLLTVSPGRVGGAESYALGVLRGLCRDNSNRITLLANEAGVEAWRPQLPGHVEIRTLPFDVTRLGGRTRAFGRAWLFRAAYQRHLPRDVDVVHFPLPIAVPPFSRPRVVTLHDVQHHDLPTLFSSRARIYRRLVYDRSARAAARVITVSESSRERILDHLALPPEHVVAIPHGVDHDRFRPERAPDDRARLESAGVRGRFLFYPANLWPHKNHPVLLQALAQSETSISLVLTGEAYGTLGQLMEQVARFGLGGRVIHLGHVDAEILPSLYRQAEMLVFPSSYEGFGAPVLEALASGCPVVCSDLPSLREIAGDAAVYVRAGDADELAVAIDGVNMADVDRARRRMAGLRRAAEFTWDKAAIAHLSVYRSVISQTGLALS